MTRLLTQHRATAEDFVKVGSRRYGNAHDPSVKLADQAGGCDRWLPQHYYEILVEKTPGVRWRRESPIISRDFPEGVTPPSGPPEDDPPSPPPATSSSASSFGNCGRMAPPATSQRSFALNEEGVYAEEINRAQGGGQCYPSSQCSVH